MKKTALFILLIGLLPAIYAQTGSNVEITNEDVKITTVGNGKAYYNNQEIATKGDVSQSAAICTRAAFNKVHLVAGTRTYLRAQEIRGTQGIVNLNNIDSLFVIPEDGYYSIDIGPIRLHASYPAKVEGRLIAKVPGVSDWIVIHLQGMETAGTTYPGFSRLLYLKAGTIFEFGLTATTTTDMVSLGEFTSDNELIIMKRSEP